MSQIESWLIDMDGVLVREEHPIPGSDRFLDQLRTRGAPFLVLTNNSMYTPRDLPGVPSAVLICRQFRAPMCLLDSFVRL